MKQHKQLTIISLLFSIFAITFVFVNIFLGLSMLPASLIIILYLMFLSFYSIFKVNFIWYIVGMFYLRLPLFHHVIRKIQIVEHQILTIVGGDLITEIEQIETAYEQFDAIQSNLESGMN